MQTEKAVDIYALGQATDNTFGRSSTTVAPTWSVKTRIIGENRLQVDYLSVITYAGEQSMRLVMNKYDAESESAINETLKSVKAEYKNISGKGLKIKKLGEPESSITPITMSAYGPVRRGYYRRRVMYELG